MAKRIYYDYAKRQISEINMRWVKRKHTYDPKHTYAGNPDDLRWSVTQKESEPDLTDRSRYL